MNPTNRTAVRLARRTAYPLLIVALLGGASFAAPPPPAGDDSLPLLPEPETPAVARTLELEELPLLVTEPPIEDDQVEIPKPVVGGGGDGLNPFSPLFLPTPQAPAPAPPTPAEAPEVTPPPVAAPAAAAADPGPAAPVPQARAGVSPLPRSLTATLRPAEVPVVVTVPLERSLGSGVAAFGPVEGFAAIRVPVGSPLGTPSYREGSAQQVVRGSVAVMGLGGSDGNFTSGSSNRVSRALATLQVHFTAMATGTGIFRVGDDTQAVLLVPGDALPGTELVLTQLTGRGAEFTEDDVRHTLFLNP